MSAVLDQRMTVTLREGNTFYGWGAFGPNGLTLETEGGSLFFFPYASINWVELRGAAPPASETAAV